MPTTGVIATGGTFAAKVSRDGRTIVGVADQTGARWNRLASWLHLVEVLRVAA